jgi:hypothetical protein
MIITIAQCCNGGTLSTIPLVDMMVIVINYENDLAEIMVVGYSILFPYNCADMRENYFLKSQETVFKLLVFMINYGCFF